MSFVSNASQPIIPLTNSIFDQTFILKWFVRIFGALLIVIGIVGNTLSALTLTRKRLRTQVTSIYLIALAISDLGNIIFSVLNFYLIRLNPNTNMRLYSNFSCKFHVFFTYYFINLSPTLLVAVSVHRYLAVAKQHYSRRYCTIKNALRTIGLICLCSLVIQIHWPIFYERSAIKSFNQTVPMKYVCNVSINYPKYIWFRSNVFGYFQWFFFTLCPFVIMLILNCSILKVISSAGKIQKRINKKNQRKRAKQRNMTIMLYSVSCVFLVLTAPASTFMAFSHLIKNLHGSRSQTLWTILSLIYYVNTAANFVLYVVTARVFRQEFRRMLFSLGLCRKSQDILVDQTLTTMTRNELSRVPTISNRDPSNYSNNPKSNLLNRFDSQSNRRSSEFDSSL